LPSEEYGEVTGVLIDKTFMTEGGEEFEGVQYVRPSDIVKGEVMEYKLRGSDGELSTFGTVQLKLINPTINPVHVSTFTDVLKRLPGDGEFDNMATGGSVTLYHMNDWDPPLVWGYSNIDKTTFDKFVTLLKHDYDFRHWAAKAEEAHKKVCELRDTSRQINREKAEAAKANSANSANAGHSEFTEEDKERVMLTTKTGDECRDHEKQAAVCLRGLRLYLASEMKEDPTCVSAELLTAANALECPRLMYEVSRALQELELDTVDKQTKYLRKVDAVMNPTNNLQRNVKTYFSTQYLNGVSEENKALWRQNDAETRIIASSLGTPPWRDMHQLQTEWMQQQQEVNYEEELVPMD
jgi:hypothetical protein